MVRDVHWIREIMSQSTDNTKIAEYSSAIQVFPGETLVRLRLWYRIIGRANSLVFDQFADSAFAVNLAPAFITWLSDPFGPLQSPLLMDTHPWLWWQRVAYDPWPYGASGVHFITPALAADGIDIKAQRAVPATETEPWVMYLWYQQADSIDWTVQGYFGASALIMEAPA